MKMFVATSRGREIVNLIDSGNYAGAMDAALKLADYEGFAKRRQESEAAGKLRGIGFSSYIEACGIAPSNVVGSLGAGVGLYESGQVRFNPTGNVQVFTGTHSHGQGHETTFAQLINEMLGVPIESVEVIHGDTAKTGTARCGHGPDMVQHGPAWRGPAWRIEVEGSGQ